MKKTLIALVILIAIAAGATWKTADNYKIAMDDIAAKITESAPDDINLTLTLVERDFSFLSGHETWLLNITLDDGLVLEVSSITSMWFFPGWITQTGEVYLSSITGDGVRSDLLQQFNIPPLTYSGTTTWRSATMNMEIPAIDVRVDNLELSTSPVAYTTTYWFANQKSDAEIDAASIVLTQSGIPILVVENFLLAATSEGSHPWMNLNATLAIDSTMTPAYSSSDTLYTFDYRLSPAELFIDLKMQENEINMDGYLVNNFNLHLNTENINGEAIAGLLDIGPITSDEDAEKVAGYIDTILKASPGIILKNLSFESPQLNYADTLSGYAKVDGSLVDDNIAETYAENPQLAGFMLRNALHLYLQSSQITAEHLMMFGLPVDAVNEVGQVLEMKGGEIFFNGQLIGQ